MLRTSCRIPDSVDLTIPSKGAVDREGFSRRVAITVPALTHDLHLPFYHPVHNVLDFLKLSPSQLHLHAWPVLLCYYVVFHMVLEPLVERYPDLNTCEFFSFYSVN